MKRALLEQLSAYLDGELSGQEKTNFEQALNNSSELQQEYQNLKKMQNLFSTLPRVKVDSKKSLASIRNEIARQNRTQEETPESLLHRFDHWLHKRFRPVIAATATCAILLIILFSTIGKSPIHKPGKNFEKDHVAQSSSTVAEKETDEIIKNYEEMSQLYYY